MNYRGKMKILIRVRRQIAPTVVHHLQSDMYCENCRYGLDDIPNDMEDESIDVCDAALIWQSNGKDEDYTFGYSEAELEAALR